MTISLTTLDKEGQIRDFTCQSNNLETMLSAISSIVATGDSLLNVYVLDGNKVTPLPIEAFDGQPLLESIQKLEQEWKRILRKPVDPGFIHRQHLIGITRQHSSRHDTYLAGLEAVISTLKQQLIKAENSLYQDPYRSQSVQQLTSNLDRYNNLLKTAYRRREIIVGELIRLTGGGGCDCQQFSDQTT